MKQVYIYDGSFDRGDRGWMLVREAAARYGWELDLPYDFEAAQIARTENGKPFFVDVPVAFSLTHSGIMWMCMFASSPCGLDLQIIERDRNWESISRRLYTQEEQHYVELWGIDGFYDIWVRKEAFGKCTGRGIFSKMPSMADGKGDLCNPISDGGLTYYFEEIAISPDMKCVCCTMDAEPVELRILG
ncbi:MAG: 4'-phosphopantetheinyl transferase superfamily protein [Firmicutes bacterium]|nr:4'-phosphopantetheinyl transferase superfamily protein [Bacillota bacterium]